MNAPYDQALAIDNCLHELADPVEASSIRPESVRLSSRPLGWRYLNVERREYEPYGAQLTPALQGGPGYTGHVQDAATGLVYMRKLPRQADTVKVEFPASDRRASRGSAYECPSAGC